MRNAILYISGLLDYGYDKSPINNINVIVNEINKKTESNILMANRILAMAIYSALTPNGKFILRMSYYDNGLFINSIFHDIPDPDNVFDKDLLIRSFKDFIHNPFIITYDKEVNFDSSARFNQLMKLFDNDMEIIIAINQVVYDNDISNDDRYLYFEKCMNIDHDIVTEYCNDCINKIVIKIYEPFNPDTVYNDL